MIDLSDLFNQVVKQHLQPCAHELLRLFVIKAHRPPQYHSLNVCSVQYLAREQGLQEVGDRLAHRLCILGEGGYQRGEKLVERVDVRRWVFKEGFHCY